MGFYFAIFAHGLFSINAYAGPADPGAQGKSIPDSAVKTTDHYERLVEYGRELTDRTFAHVGPEVKNKKMRYSGNNLACSSCHEGSGTKKYAIPFTGIYGSFPMYRPREDEVGTLEERINGCMERSMAGRALPLNSREMKAFVTYIHSLSKDVPIGGKVEGRGLATFKAPDRRADVAAGSTVYQEKCVTCHAVDGAGLRSGPAGSAAGYTYPPLWGNDSFNNGAGMNRLLTASAFIKANMPLGTEHGKSPDRGGLTDDEAYDVAAFIVSQPRPKKRHLERDYPARWNKPVDCAFPPYVDGAPADQHKYGPFAPLQKNMELLIQK